MKVQVTKNNQYIITIPKALAEALNLKQGTKLKFKLNQKGEVILKNEK